MPKQHDFEARLVRTLAAYTTVVENDFDQRTIARRAMNGRGGWRGLFPSRPLMGMVRIVFALLLLAVALAAAALIASQNPDPRELVRQSQAVHADPPAFTMTITAFAPPGGGVGLGCSSSQANAPVRYLYFYDGADGFRFECLAEGDARGTDFHVRRGNASGSFIGGEWHEPAVGEIVEAPGTVRYLNWGGIGQDDTGRRRTSQPEGRFDCPAWSFGGRDAIADRLAWKVSCGEERYWIDARSHLLVGLSIGDTIVSQATALEIGSPSDDLFEVAPPERTRRYLVVGQTVTEWELPVYDAAGATARFFRSTSLAGRPAVVLFHDAEDCRQTPCFSIADFSAVVASYRDRIGSVIIAEGEYPETSVQQALRAGTPMVSDDGSVAPAWLAEPGTVAFIDENGNVHSLLSPNRGTTRGILSDNIDRFVDDGAFATARPSSEDAP